MPSPKETAEELAEFFIGYPCGTSKMLADGIKRLETSARNDALEEAAKVIEDWAKLTWPTTNEDEADDLAAAIRALKR